MIIQSQPPTPCSTILSALFIRSPGYCNKTRKPYEPMNREADPVWADIRCVLPIGNGRLVLSGWPGLRLTPAGDAWIDPEASVATLEHLRGLGATVVVGLCETADLPGPAILQLRHWSRRQSLRFLHAPIRDYYPPGNRFFRRWRMLRAFLHGQIETGAAIALTCSYGAGRSGTVAALLLAEHGLPMTDAVRQVRAEFHAAIESAVQERWLLKHLPAGKPNIRP